MIRRDLEDKIDPWLLRDKIVILKGARQVGKTTILKAIQEDLEKNGRLVRYIATPYELLDGHAVENAVWSSIVGSFPAESVKYWRRAAGAEIDFIIETVTGILPVEVKFSSPRHASRSP
ncbi:MAG: DUF4143 domain-containing protein [Rectinemataceae bacterium]